MDQIYLHLYFLTCIFLILLLIALLYAHKNNIQLHWIELLSIVCVSLLIKKNE